MANLSQLQRGSVTYDLKALALKYIVGTGTAAVTSSPYTYAKWEASASEITSLYDGLTILYKVPIAGNGSYGTCLQLNSLGYHPVVTHTNTMIGTRYGVGAVIMLVYNAGLSGTVYANSSSSSNITGVWVAVNDYDSGNSSAYMYYQVYSEAKTKTVLYRYQLLLTYDETQVFPINTVNNTTATSKTLTTEEFDPFGPIYYWNSTSTVNANTQLANWAGLYRAYHGVDLRYSFNTGSSLVANKAVYMVCTPQSNGKAKLSTTPISQELPVADDGKIYIYLGRSYSTYQITLDMYHPVYYYKDGALRLWTNGSAQELFIVNATLTSATEGTSDKTSTEIYNAVVAGKLPVVKINYGSASMMASLVRIEPTDPAGNYIAIFVYEDQTDASDPLQYARLRIIGTSVTLAWENGYINHNHDDVYAKKTDLDTLVAATDAMVFKGTLGSGGDYASLPNDHTNGDTYKVITAGTYAGQTCEIGDLVICINTSTTANNADWTVAQTNIDGAVTGPASSTSGHIAVFSGTSGKVIADTGSVTGSITMYTPSGDSPAIIFQRGDLNDDYNDWQIVDSGGYLRFKERGKNSTGWTERVYFTTGGMVVATTFSGSLSGNATSATKANLTTTTNAVAYYTDTAGTFGTVQSKDGALYSTGTDSALQFGTLPVAQGGTGVKTFTANSLVLTGSTTTAALTTRAITDNTSNAAVTSNNTNIPTMNTIYYGLATINGASQTRATNVIAATTTAPGTNAILYASGTGTTSALSWLASAKGALYSTSTNSSLTFSTLPVSCGGTGMTTASWKNAVIIGNSTTASSAMQPVRTASGALYSTTQDGAPQFGTLPVAQGGTGNASFTTSYRLLMTSSTSTGALQTLSSGTQGMILAATNLNKAPAWVAPDKTTVLNSASASGGSAAAWSVSVVSEVLTFSWTANTLQTVTYTTTTVWCGVTTSNDGSD